MLWVPILNRYERRCLFTFAEIIDTYYNNTKVGQIMARITSDLFDVTEFAHHCPEEFFIAGFKSGHFFYNFN